jgi:vacuolar iron transporter family protein
MMREELGFGADIADPPLRSGITVGLSYLIGAAIPVLPYLFVLPHLGIYISACTTVSALFGIGAAKTLITARSWWRSGLESMAIGIAAGIVTYSAGLLLSRR